MKEIILGIALSLIHKNGQTTTLEVKNAAHEAFGGDPTFELTQKEVSDILKQLSAERGWTKDIVRGVGPSYFNYSLPPFTAPAHPNMRDLLEAEVSHDADDATPVPVQKHKQRAASVNHSGELVCYVSGMPELFQFGSSRKELMNATFNEFKDQVPGLTYNNLNVCSRKYFMGKYQ